MSQSKFFSEPVEYCLVAYSSSELLRTLRSSYVATCTGHFGRAFYYSLASTDIFQMVLELIRRAGGR